MKKSAQTKILVRAPNWIGDQVMAYPFFHYLRETFPNSRIVAACAPWVASIQFRNLVDDVLVLPKPSDRTWTARIQAIEAGARQARELASGDPWDLGISLPNSFSSAWFLFRAGCLKRRGYRGDARSFLLNDALRCEDGMHRTESYAQLLPAGPDDEFARRVPAKEFWGVPPEAPENVDESAEGAEEGSLLPLDDEGIPGVLREFDAAHAWLPEVEALAPPQEARQGYVVFAPGSVAESRRWPIHKFAALADRIISETGWAVVLVGGAAETALAEELIAEIKTGRNRRFVFDMTGKGSVGSYWRIFRNAKMTVANDSGLSHVAVLCGSPVHVIWGAGEPKITAPLGPGKVKMSVSIVDCWPCERNVCYKSGIEKIACLRGIDPDAVWKEINRGLRP